MLKTKNTGKPVTIKTWKLYGAVWPERIEVEGVEYSFEGWGAELDDDGLLLYYKAENGEVATINSWQANREK